jgi:hypothetical protein
MSSLQRVWASVVIPAVSYGTAGLFFQEHADWMITGEMRTSRMSGARARCEVGYGTVDRHAE